VPSKQQTGGTRGGIEMPRVDRFQWRYEQN